MKAVFLKDIKNLNLRPEDRKALAAAAVDNKQAEEKKITRSDESVIKYLTDITKNSQASIESVAKLLAGILSEIRKAQSESDKTLKEVVRKQERKPLNLDIKFVRNSSKLIESARITET